MNISIITAMSVNNIIGINNELPWHLPNDLKHFKHLTLNKTIIMGRKTWESLPFKPLPNRKNIIISKNKIKGQFTYDTLNYALCDLKDGPEVFIIGGGYTYAQCIGFANTLYITLVNCIINPTLNNVVHFPQINYNDWKLTSNIYNMKNNTHDFEYNFMVYKRRKEP